MKRRKIIAVCMCLIYLFITLYHIPVLAANEVNIGDFNSISSLPVDYSYGTVFWTSKSQIMTLSSHTASYVNVESSRYVHYGALKNQKISVLITNCAVDKDGDLCDVVATISDITPFTVSPTTNALAENFTNYPNLSTDLDKTGIENVIRSELIIGSNNGLVRFTFMTNHASGNFSLAYYKAGTCTNGTYVRANVSNNSALIYDIDVSIDKVDNKNDYSNEMFKGCEGFTVPNGNIYYDTNGYLINTDDGKGVRVPKTQEYQEWLTENNKTSNPVNGIDKYTSAVNTQALTNATYNLTYSGRTCGILYVFASPYTFENVAPKITVNPNRVFEEETFEYKISQYVPNNYYASDLAFVSRIGGRYSKLDIVDTLNSNLVINGDISVTNESEEDVTSYFNISKSGNTVTAAAKTETLQNADFYAHTYTVHVPAYMKNGTGKTMSTVPNSAYTDLKTTNSSTSQKLNTNTVNVYLKYNVTINGQITNGLMTIQKEGPGDSVTKTTVVNHGESANQIVGFKINEGYQIKSVVVDGQEVTSYIEDKGMYVYEFDDSNVNQNITHTIVVDAELKDAKVTANYLDEEGTKIAVSTEYKGKVFDEYETKAKEIYGYELIEVPQNAVGEMTEEPIIVNYIYKLKDAKVTANYVNENGETLSESITKEGKVYDKYETEAKKINGYELIAVPENATGEMTEEPIVVNYVYKLKDAKVTANYIDEKGKKLEEPVIQNGKVFEQYKTEAKEIYGYELIAEPENATGEMTEEPITVNYVYKLKKATVITQYEDEEGNELEKPVIQEGNVFDEYKTEEKEIDGYELIEVPKNATGTITEEPITVIYKYKLKDTTVIVNYVDENGDEIAASKVIEGKVFEEYTTEPKTINGYELVETPSNATGFMEEEAITVTYVYKKTVKTPTYTETIKEAAKSVIYTGENSQAWIYIAMIAIASISIISLIVVKIIKRRNEK